MGKNDCIPAKVVVLVEKLLYSGKSGCTRANWLYSGKVGVFGKDGCIWAKVVLFEQKWLHSLKSCVVLGKIGCFR